MDLGLLYEFDVPQPWAGEHPWGQRTAERRVYQENIEQIVHADRYGFDTVWCVEHHFRENRSHMPCSEAVLGALSHITENIKLGFGVTLAPHEFIHPARLAEKVATVDLLSRGRVQWGIGRSTPMEQTAFGVDRGRSREKMLAAVRSVVGMWEQQYYEEHSEFLDFPKRMVTPKPHQFPHPPVWMATSSDGGAEMAGSNGLGMLLFGIMTPLDKLSVLIDTYRKAQAGANPLTGVTTNKVGIYTLVYCTETRDNFGSDRLWDSVWWWYKGLAEFTLKWELAHEDEETRAKAFPALKKYADGDFDIHHFDREDMIVIGTPDDCIRKFLRYADIGVDQVLCYLNFGYLPHEAVMKTIELLGTYVIPELKKRGAKSMADAVGSAIRKEEKRQSAAD